MKSDPNLLEAAFVDQVIDDALRFARTHRNATVWAEWARTLPPKKRSVFEAIAENRTTANTGDADESRPGNKGLPTFGGLSHELRSMLNEAFRIWNAGPS